MRTILAIIVASIAAQSALARAPEARPRAGMLTVIWENDIFLRQDNEYTNGLAFSWTTADVRTFGERNFFRRMLGTVRFLPTFNDSERTQYATIHFGQEMYTPSDITDPDPPLGEQPYAGVLFLDTGVHSTGPRSQHSWILRLGVVGPSSGAEQVQRFIHELMGYEIPQGWDTQLSNEFLLNVDYVYRHRLVRAIGRSGFGYDAALSGSAGAGNYFIGASAGAEFRFGLYLPETYGNPRVRRDRDALVGWRPEPGKWRVFLRAGTEVFGVARFLPTDGNTFVDSRSTERDDWLVLLDGAIVVSRSQFCAAYSYTAALGGTNTNFWSRDQDYGAITLSWVF
jgi:hypothetical protein